MAARPLDDVISRRSFIQATEVWIPDSMDECLIRAEGLCGPLDAFDGASADHGFARGQGLPGRAWAEGRPILITDLQSSAFPRSKAAGLAGLGAAAAIPVFSAGKLKGVLVMFCGDDDTGVGAIEIWRGDDAPQSRMRLDVGFYGAAARFREVSERSEFERGQGLPGGVWAARVPILMRDLGSGHGFVRAASASAAGLTTGLGVPVPTPADDDYVLTLLSARDTPIARRFELWDVTPGKGGRQPVATLADGLCDVDGPLWNTERKIRPWQGAVGRALATGVPVAEPRSAAPGGGFHTGTVALPIHAHGEVTRVVAWFF